jgi:glutathione S-transferase
MNNKAHRDAMIKPYKIYGVRPSYFTQKAIGFFRFKGIPFEDLNKTVFEQKRLEVGSGTRMIPVVECPDGSWMKDTTPMGMALDAIFPDGGLFPSAVNPKLAEARIVGRIVEDYLDEWFPRFAVHFRWMYDAGIAVGADRIVRDMVGAPAKGDMPDAQKAMYDLAVEKFSDWGKGTCESVGAGEARKPETRAEFIRIIKIFNGILDRQDYLIGNRPTLADFALWGGLYAHFNFDPTPKALIAKYAPNLNVFETRLKDARVSDMPSWQDVQISLDVLDPLLAEIGGNFMPFLMTNKAALEAGEKGFEAAVDGDDLPFRSRKYMESCRLDIAVEIADLDYDTQARLEARLNPHGCWKAYI